MSNKSMTSTLDFAYKCIAEQFPEYASLTIDNFDKQRHDNRTYRLGRKMVIPLSMAAD